MKNIEVPEHVILDNLYVNVVLGRDFFENILLHYGKDGWNDYVRKLRLHNMWAMYSTPEPTEDDEHCMPVCLQIDWKGLSFSGSDLSGLDLTLPMMEGCNFNGANLNSSTLGDVRHASFREACLQGAHFQGDISGCDFSDADTEAASFDGAVYYQEDPPRSLSAGLLARCRLFPPEREFGKEPVEDEPSHTLIPRSVELRSFWGALQ